MSACSNDGVSIHDAAKAGDEIRIYELLEENIDVNVLDKAGFTPLARAAGKGHAKVVRMLIENGADVDGGDHPDIAPALVQAAFGGHTTIVEILLERGAGFNAADQFTSVREKALHVAASHGHVEMLKHLLNAGVDVNRRQMHWGTTPLSSAARKGDTQMVTLLLSHGAEFQSVDIWGRNALDMAIEYGHDEIIAILESHGAKPSPSKALRHEITIELDSDFLYDHFPDQLLAALADLGRQNPRFVDTFGEFDLEVQDELEMFHRTVGVDGTVHREAHLKITGTKSSGEMSIDLRPASQIIVFSVRVTYTDVKRGETAMYLLEGACNEE
jgi:ankyrin repeat protein